MTTASIAVMIGYALLLLILLTMICRAFFVAGRARGYQQGFDDAASQYGWLPPLNLKVADLDHLPTVGRGGGGGAPLPTGISTHTSLAGIGGNAGRPE